MEQFDIIATAIKAQVILPLFYHDDAETCIDITRALYAGGIRAIEFTNRGSAALSNFRALVEWRKQAPDLLLGVGTITSSEQALAFMEAGADFLISPIFDSNVADTCYLHKMPWLPGCMTPTEIHIAEQAGCKMIKLFPGNVLGPGFVSAIKPLFKGLDFVVTGGVEANKENIDVWKKSGAVAVGLGSKFIAEDIIRTKQYEKLTELTQTLLTTIADANNNR